MGETVRAIGLFSGGLDSLLASRLLQEQGVEVIGYTFVTPFFGPEQALRSREQIGIQLEIEEITDIYMEILKRPKYGFGKNMNPCIDCHALMFRLAGERLEKHGARFLFSGEVLGERPFSQTKGALRAVANLSGQRDLILRPLSARLLEETLAERRGWVDRLRLEDIQGRSRKRQMALAERFGITDYPKPAGGCRLTEPQYAKRLRDLLSRMPDPPRREMELLKLGRHLRWDDGTKIIVGRREEENNRLDALCGPEDVRLWVKGVPGPTVLLPLQPEPHPEALRFAASLAARYSDASPEEPVEVVCARQGRSEVLLVAPCGQEEIDPRLL